MGVDHLFHGEGDLSAFSTTSRLGFEGIVHKAKLTVDEKGSQLSGATGTTGRGIKITPSFICDHPFVFAIHDDQLQEILFTAVYMDPK